MQIGIGLDPTLRLSYAQQAEMVREALRLGYTSAWTPAGMGRDAFLTCAQWSAAATGASGIPTGIAVVPVHLWTVPSLAALAGTVGDLSGGRFVLGIGTGGYSDEARRDYGQPPVPAISLMRDYLLTLRRLLAGERVDYDGQAVKLRGVRLAFTPPRVPVYLGALGPQMLRLAGEAADGACLNWCTPEQIAWSRERAAEGARRAGRDPAAMQIVEYIRICVDEDEDTARRAFTRAVMGYALARPGAPKDMGYRAHFARMGFDDALTDLEARRDRGATEAELIENFPRDLLLKVGYFGSAASAAPAFRRLAAGLDVAIARVVAARPTPESAAAVMRACAPGA
ncbi:MAG: LLM class flavin-dependent oxidoreductase [Chloroflexi bacterium]|nr:LLM class flavin-dependent oxidoreductase [Chloroflexota bacterium]